MYLVIILLPALAFLTVGLFGRKCGKSGAQIITTSSITISAILALIGFYEVGLKNSPVSIKAITWLESESLIVDWGFIFDPVSITMCVVILSISALVHLYSIDYMSGDPHIQRFFSYLSLFTFFMLILVTSDNFLLMFIGWEGVGVSSYLLINFWFTRIQANKAAIKALLMNRVGDWGFSIALFGLFFLFGNFDFSTVFSTSNYINDISMIYYNDFSNNHSFVDNQSLITFLTLFLLLAAMGKSAQIGLHTWLVDAMEGPTPVSALIHAATMVTAGVYLIIRSSPLFELAPTSLICVSAVGAITALFAATSGLFQNDLKRVIAYSTCSQLGYMVFVAGLSQYSVSLFHLFNHAYFKALLFLSAGSIIHALHDEQDMRKMGGLVNLLPFTYTMILIGSLSLMALPFLTGYYSKDVILEIAYGQYYITGTFTYWLGTLTAIITAYYSFKLISYTFFGTPNGSKYIYESAHEASLIMSIPLFILSLASIFIGFIAKDLFIGLGTTFWNNSLFTHPNNYLGVDIEFGLTPLVKFYPLIGSLLGVFICLLITKPFNKEIFSDIVKYRSIDLKEKLEVTFLLRLIKFFNRRYWFDNIYNNLFLAGGLHLGYITGYILDRGIIEIIGPTGLSNSIIRFGNIAKELDSGFIPHYALYILLGTIFFIVLTIFTDITVYNNLYLSYGSLILLIILIPLSLTYIYDKS